MNNKSRSTFIFNLIDEFEIFDKFGKEKEFTDEAYNLFCEKYKSLSIDRDKSLFYHLSSTPNLFRIHLPHSQWVMAIVSEIVWYYDEIIISDPILQLIKTEGGDNEAKKNWIKESLRYIMTFKESIIGGYLLFGGDNMIPCKTGNFDEIGKILVEVPQVLDAFELITAMGQKPSPINNNVNDNLTQLEVLFNGMWGEVRSMATYFPEHILNDSSKLSNGITYNFTTPYERLTREGLIKFNKLELLTSLKKEYIKDISVVLETITNAQRLNLPVLFYRDVDTITAKNYSNSSSNNIVNTTIYDCDLPYIQGISGERLFDVRNQIPEAFVDFRAFLFQLVTETMNKTNNEAEVNYIIDSKINSLLRQLNVEMKNASRKWDIQGLGVPLVLAAGSLSLVSSGMDYSSMLSTIMGSGGIAKSLATWNNVKKDKDNAALNPTYFLWKAQNNK